MPGPHFEIAVTTPEQMLEYYERHGSSDLIDHRRSLDHLLRYFKALLDVKMKESEAILLQAASALRDLVPSIVERIESTKGEGDASVARAKALVIQALQPPEKAATPAQLQQAILRAENFSGQLEAVDAELADLLGRAKRILDQIDDLRSLATPLENSLRAYRSARASVFLLKSIRQFLRLLLLFTAFLIAAFLEFRLSPLLEQCLRAPIAANARLSVFVIIFIAGYLLIDPLLDRIDRRATLSLYGYALSLLKQEVASIGTGHQKMAEVLKSIQSDEEH